MPRRPCPPGDRLWCQGCHLGNHDCDAVPWCRHRATTGVLMRHEELVRVGIVERHGEIFDHAKDADGHWWRWSHTHDRWLGVASTPAPTHDGPPDLDDDKAVR